MNIEVCSVQEMYQALQTKADGNVFLDVRTPGEVRSVSIEGTLNLPLNELDKRLNELRSYQKIYVFCHNGIRTRQAVKKLQSQGLHAIAVDGGISAWQRAGLPVLQSSKSLAISVPPINQQVQIIVGISILLGWYLSMRVHPAFIYLTVAMGIGMLFTGLTGNCIMARMLAVMPWNR